MWKSGGFFLHLFKKVMRCIFFLLIFLSGGIALSALNAQCPQLVWADEFDGETLDQSKWSYQIGDGCDIHPDLCGWGNNELQYYRRANAVVSDGTLKIEARRESAGGRNYTSARLRSIDQGDWTYGRFEARIKLPFGQGIWPAFWMLPTDEVYGGWPESGEIDIMELIGSEPATVHGTIHYGRPWPNNASSGTAFHLQQGIFNDAFHEFAVEWEPNEIRWYVDGYHYFTRTRTDVAPNRWPFDQDFHFLLNVAVGGNWPGNPDGSTIFPQIMEVDYVRVYDLSQAALSGNRQVSHQAQGETYTVDNAAEGATFTWSTPPGAAIVSGQGTESITVDWGPEGGTLSVTINSTCGERQLRTGVAVEPAFVPSLTLEDFDTEALIDYTSATGVFTDEAANPGANAVNESALCGAYVRNAAEQFDVLVYQTGAIDDAGAFVDNEQKFVLDVYTDAPPGTLILLQLENSGQAQSDNYPAGRHSRYEAYTTKQNEWERLEFSFLDQPDPSVGPGGIDQLILLFASNTRTGDTYHFDNFEIYAQEESTSLRPAPLMEGHFQVQPNPVAGQLQVRYEGPAELQRLHLTDPAGRLLWQWRPTLKDGEQVELDVSTLPAGVYFLQGFDAAGGVRVERIVKK